MHLIYTILSYLVIGLFLPLWMLHPKLRDGIKRRLGFYGERDVSERPWPKTRGRGPRIWLHGASAGDLLALLPIILEIREQEPASTLVVSSMTNTGFTMAHRKLGPHVDGVTYVPYDLPGATRRALEVIQPDLLVLEYTEIWPNLLAAAKRFGARLAMTNGRISENLLRRYRYLFFLIGNQLQKFDVLLMREEVEASRACTLGAPPKKVLVTGNTKFDNLKESPGQDTVASLKTGLRLGDALVLVAGSTHEGEERILLEGLRALRDAGLLVRMVVAPRYVDRAGRVASLVRAAGFSVLLRTEATVQSGAALEPDVVILDTMGELSVAYSLATVVFVGGSFVPRGGQNILEPAGLGKPVLFGPHMMNFRDSVEILVGRGGIQVNSPTQLIKVLKELLQRPDEIASLGRMAEVAVRRLQGASSRNAKHLLALCE